MQSNEYLYLMENEKETYRLDVKTDKKVVKKQALWAGIKPGMLLMYAVGLGKQPLCYTNWFNLVV